MNAIRFQATLAAMVGLLSLVIVPIDLAYATVITFDNYVSPTNNDLTNNFNQTGFPGFPTPYVQSPTGGITGGSVTGVSGSDYTATAVYTPSTFNFSTPGATIPLSVDFFFNGQLTPLAPGANGVRSFRLGLLDASTSAFETLGNASAYIEGLYSLTTNNLQLVARNMTGSALTSIAIGSASLNANNWYQLNASFTNEGNNQILYSQTFFDLGSNGQAIPLLLSTASSSFENDPMTSLDAAYAGFSALADGGILQADNFDVPTPLPAALPLFATGIGAFGLLSWRRKRKGQVA